MVADKKVEEYKNLRPTIKALGPVRVKQLVLRILDDLTAGSYKEAEILKEFPMSKSTLSRFTGIRWGKGRGASASDLLKNIVEVVGNNAMFNVYVVRTFWTGDVQN